MTFLFADSTAVPVDGSALWGGLGLLGAAVLCAALWWFSTRKYRAMGSRRVRVEGTVVAVTRVGGFDGIPSVQYFDEQGVEHLCRGSTSTSARAGSKADVYYDRQDPSLAIQVLDLALTRVFAWGGVVTVVVGLGCIVLYFLAA